MGIRNTSYFSPQNKERPKMICVRRSREPINIAVGLSKIIGFYLTHPSAEFKLAKMYDVKIDTYKQSWLCN